jgi:aspartyl-tRNA(Asn)/glutamyl-tRNA(Gln) amidotransferase subunit C
LLSVIFVYMEITTALTDHLAHLARLHFHEHEKEEIRQDLAKMVGFVEKLAELNTETVVPLMHMGQSQNVLREDEITGSVSRKEALLNATGADDQFFKVPKVIRK